MSPSPRLHVLLGAGGVGKTTLAAGLALSLSRSGRRVGLLGIDPSFRLRQALGLRDLPEQGVPVPGTTLRAALLRPGDSLRRWAADELEDPAERQSLLANPFFLALADRMAGAADLIAAIRIAEWAERDPSLDDLVLDTAPGLHAVEALGKPERLSAVLDGRLLEWLHAAVKAQRARGLGGLFRVVARRTFSTLGKLTGAEAVTSLATFSLLVDRLAATLLERLARAGAWLHSGEAALLIVTAPRSGGDEAVARIEERLRAMGLAPRAAVLNRALPASLAQEVLPARSEAAQSFARYLHGCALQQERLAAVLAGRGLPLLRVPAIEGLSQQGADRLSALASLGDGVRAQLAGATPRAA
jgi:anion-transporting  ArsA/GET3 family ATPase